MASWIFPLVSVVEIWGGRNGGGDYEDLLMNVSLFGEVASVEREILELRFREIIIESFCIKRSM